MTLGLCPINPCPISRFSRLLLLSVNDGKSISNRLRLNFVGLDELPIIKNRRRYDLNGLDISVYDSDEKCVDAQEKIEDNQIGVTNKPIYDDNRDEDSMQDYLREKHTFSWDRDKDRLLDK